MLNWIMAGFCLLSGISCLVMFWRIKALLTYQQFLEARVVVLEKSRDELLIKLIMKAVEMFGKDLFKEEQ